MEKILLIDDDKEICMLVKDFLNTEGYDVRALHAPQESMGVVEAYRPDLIVLDILMPEENGLSVCQKIRRASLTPIILASAKGSESDKVLGLGIGADDYLQKPYGMNELVARIKALLRRARYAQEVDERVDEMVRRGDFTADTKAYTVEYRGACLPLTMKEYKLLVFLMTHENQVLDKEYLYENIWGYGSAGDIRTVMVHIRKLRCKIEDDPDHPRHILTVWGMGYKFIARPS